MATGRTNSSGFVVKAGGGTNTYLRQTSGYVVSNTGQGNLSTQVPRYASGSLNYSEPQKSNKVGVIVPVAR
jgi:hypothetical protein